MNKALHHSPRRCQTAVYFVAAALAMALSCTNFPTPFENVVADQKIRPFAVVCDPPEAAPGDTVSVRLYYYDPAGDRPLPSWKLALDYGTDLRGNEFEKHVVNLDSMMLPGSVPDSFRFRVPDSVLFYSTQISELLDNRAINPMHVPIATIDSTLKTSAETPVYTPQLITLADNVSCRIRLRAQLRSEISLDVTMPLRIRYSRRLNSPDVNKNPTIGWMGILKVPRADYTATDSLSTIGGTLYYLYNAAHPDRGSDTVEIDSGCTYFAVADSGENQRQTYHYLSFNTTSETVDTETFNYSWFYTNLDYYSGMIMDSLLIFANNRAGAVNRLLPSVDTAMHRFALYLVVRDARRGDLNATPGEAFEAVQGYFSYTAAYARHASRSAVRTGAGRLRPQ